MIRSIDHLTIVVSDLNKTQQFFSLLGFLGTTPSNLNSEFLEKLTGLKNVSGRFIELNHPNSDLTIELLEFDSNQNLADTNIGKANQIGFRHLALEVNDIEAVYRELQSHGIHFLSPILTWHKTGKKLVYFHGPDGILLELAEYPSTFERESVLKLQS